MTAPRVGEAIAPRPDATRRSGLAAVARFEIAYQLRRPATWLFLVVFAGLGVQFAAGINAGEGVHANAPVLLGLTLALSTMFGLVVTGAVAGDAAARDAATGVSPLIATTPLRRHEYVLGRYLGALGVGAILLAVVAAAHAVAIATPLVDPASAGAFRPLAYIAAYGWVGLPNVAFATALVFAAGLLGRRVRAGYGMAIVLFVGGMMMNGPAADALARWGLGPVLEPFGMVALSELTGSWTAARQNTALVGLEGALGWNRLLLLAVGAAALGIACLRYHPLPEGGRRRRRGTWRAARPGGVVSPGGGVLPGDAAQGWMAAHAVPGARPPPAAVVDVPDVSRSFGLATHIRQTLSIAARSIHEIASSRIVLVIPAVGAIAVLAGPELMEHLGVPLRPTAGMLVERVTDPMFRLLAPLFTILFAGELVWSERDVRIAGIADATPVPAPAFLLGRLLGLAALLVAIQALAFAAGLAVQLRLGHRPLELGLHAAILFGLQLPGHLLFAAAVLFVHVLVNQKYAGHLIAVLVWTLTLMASRLGIEHPLLGGVAPGWSWSALRGFGPTLAPFLWLQAYWAGWALLLGVASVWLWMRGEDDRPPARARAARRRITARSSAIALAALAIVAVAGGWTFYNTDVLHDHRPLEERIDRRAEYERRYAGYADAPQPRVTAIALEVDLRPRLGAATLTGTYALRNDSGEPIDTIHVATATDVETSAIVFDRPFGTALVDDDLGHRIYGLGSPLPPGASVTMRFQVRHDPRGFTTGGAATEVTAAATHFEAEEWLPALGYQRNREIPVADERRKRGLQPRPRIRALEDPAAPRDFAGRERVALDLVISTDSGQVPVGPGRQVRSWTEDGRRYARFTAASMRRGFPIFSARYESYELPWRDLDIEVLHAPEHAWYVEGMARAARAALDYHVERYGPYTYDWMRLVEAPGLAIGLRSHAGVIRYFEGYAHMHPEADTRDLDFAFAVMAHEVAHQWWGHRLIPAGAEGAPLLSESLAWYTALGVVEDTYGEAHLERLLGLMREAYREARPPDRPPLLRSVDEFAAYRQGPLSMYSLREYVGPERIDEALRRLLAEYDAAEPPLPTSLALYDELRALTPDSLRPLLSDLLEHNTRWNLAITDARAEAAADGTWELTLDVRAGKERVDSAGVATERPLAEPVEIGVYAEGHDGRRGERLHLAMHAVRSGEQTITIRIDERPESVRLDPRYLLVGSNRSRARSVTTRADSAVVAARFQASADADDPVAHFIDPEGRRAFVDDTERRYRAAVAGQEDG